MMATSLALAGAFGFGAVLIVAVIVRATRIVGPTGEADQCDCSSLDPCPEHEGDWQW